MSNEALSPDDALSFFIMGVFLMVAGTALLVRYFLLRRHKAAVYKIFRQEGIFISLAALGFGCLLATGGGLYYFMPHAASLMYKIVGGLFILECLVTLLFLRLHHGAWHSRRSAEQLEREHHGVLIRDQEPPNGR